MRVLGEKSVAGMDRIDIANLGCAHDSVDFEVAFRAGRRADTNGFVCKLNMQRIDVGLRVNRQRSDAELLAGANHAQRNLTAIGNQDFFKHGLARQGNGPLAWFSSAQLQAMRLPYNQIFSDASTNFKKHLPELDGFTVFGHYFGDHTTHSRP